MYTLTVKYMNLPLPNFLLISCIWGEEREKGNREEGRERGGEGREGDGGKGQGHVVKTYLYIIQICAGKGYSVLE